MKRAGVGPVSQVWNNSVYIYCIHIFLETNAGFPESLYCKTSPQPSMSILLRTNGSYNLNYLSKLQKMFSVMLPLACLEVKLINTPWKINYGWLCSTGIKPTNTHLACLPSHTHSHKCWANQDDICITHRHLISACMHTKTLKYSVRCQTYLLML